MGLNVDAIINNAGGPQALARKLGIAHSAVCDWRDRGFLPAARIAQFHHLFGYDVHDLLGCTHQIGTPPKRAVAENPERVSIRETTGAATP